MGDMLRFVRAPSLLTACFGTALTGLLAYAVYFDYKRRTSPEFRRHLRHQARQSQRWLKAREEAASRKFKEEIRTRLNLAKGDLISTMELGESAEEFFMKEVSAGEMLSRSDDPIAAALCFYRALKVYPRKSDLIGIYKKTVSKSLMAVIDEMISLDSELSSALRDTD